MGSIPAIMGTKSRDLVMNLAHCVCVCSVMYDSSRPHLTPLSLEFSRQEYWIGSPFTTLADPPNPRIKPPSPASPVLTGGFFTHLGSL